MPKDEPKNKTDIFIIVLKNILSSFLSDLWLLEFLRQRWCFPVQNCIYLRLTTALAAYESMEITKYAVKG